MNNTTKQTVLCFLNQESNIQILILKSGFSDPSNGDPLYHVIIEQVNEEEPLITTLILTAAQILEKINISIDPDKFTSQSFLSLVDPKQDAIGKIILSSK